MPIYEFACPKCQMIFNFFSARIQPHRLPFCPKCGNKKMTKQISAFAAPRRRNQPGPSLDDPGPGGAGSGEPNLDDPRVARAMSEMEREMPYLDENNPKHMAHMMRKMKEILPAEAMPKELDVAIKRLEAGDSPEKIEEDMGDVLGGLMGGEDPEGSGGGTSGYSRDSGLYDY